MEGARDLSFSDILKHLEPEDLIKYGLIPELVGRIPVAATLEELAREDLIKILQEPKNALVKQFKKLFAMDNIDLHFTDGAIKAVAEEAIKRKTGARGLRAILEKAMLEVMYDLPSRENVKECVISEEVILRRAEPILIYESKQAEAS